MFLTFVKDSLISADFFSPTTFVNALSASLPTAPAVIFADKETVDHLSDVQKGACIDNSLDENQYTALHYAAINDDTEIATNLISNGADVNAQNKDFYTPLHFAIQKGNTEVVSLLLARDDIDVNTQNKDLYTPLHFARLGGFKQSPQNGASDVLEIIKKDRKTFMIPFIKEFILSVDLAKKEIHAVITQ